MADKADNLKYVLVDGALIPTDQPAIPVTSRGLMYGDGCFETFCAYNGRFFKLDEHLKRLREGLDFLGIEYPPDLQPDAIRSLLRSLLVKNDFEVGKSVFRLQVWRKGVRGYATNSSDSRYAVTVSLIASTTSSLYTLSTVSIPRIPAAVLPSQYKFTNGLNYISAAREARENGADDALMLTLDGWISETSIANIFWLKDNAVFTPSAACDLLPGITRDSIIGIIEQNFELPVRQGKYMLADIENADGVWMCNSVREVQPVTQLDETKFVSDHPFIDKLQSAYEAHLHEEVN